MNQKVIGLALNKFKTLNPAAIGTRLQEIKLSVFFPLRNMDKYSNSGVRMATANMDRIARKRVRRFPSLFHAMATIFKVLGTRDDRGGHICPCRTAAMPTVPKCTEYGLLFHSVT
jgi:hypothetical protein